MNKSSLAGIFLAAAVLAASGAYAQNSAMPQVSAITLQVVQNSDGSQSVITPKGDLATLPGAGVNGDLAQIFAGSQGGFWYVDRTGQTIDLQSAVNSLQARRARAAQAAQVPQYAPEPYYEEQPVQQETSSGTGSGVVSALGTAAAAGAGAMVGSAMSNRYYNAPYGTPMYYGAGAHPYYYNNGNRRELDDLSPNQKAVLYNKHQLNNQHTAANAQINRTTNNYHNQQVNFEHQQNWYQNQLKENPHKFQKSASNPFAAQHVSDRRASGGGAYNHGGSYNRGGREISHHAAARPARGGGGISRGGGGRGGGGRRGR